MHDQRWLLADPVAAVDQLDHLGERIKSGPLTGLLHGPVHPISPDPLDPPSEMSQVEVGVPRVQVPLAGEPTHPLAVGADGHACRLAVHHR